MTTETTAAPGLWSVPREWAGDRCFVLCTGESIGKQKKQIQQLKGRFIVVKHAVSLRPDADVMFLAGEMQIERPLLSLFRGSYVVMRRGNHADDAPAYVNRLTRTKDHEHLCDLPTHVCGLDSGTSSIDLAYKFGATEIVLLGYDMTGGHFCKHPKQFPSPAEFRRHTGQHMLSFAADAKAKGIRIVNCSPTSAVTYFEKQPLEAFL